MKKLIVDTVQITLALLITSGMTYALPSQKPPAVIKPVAAKVAQAPAPVEQPKAPAATPEPVPTPAVEPVPEPAPVVEDNWYRDYIFDHESSNTLEKINSIGCYGLGQDCNNVLSTACPDWQTNRDCQLSFWNDYAVRRYGGWPQSYQFWITHYDANGNHWW